MRLSGTRTRCWATEPEEMLERTASGSEGGPQFLMFRFVTLTPRAMGIASRKKVLESAARRKKDKYEEVCLERRQGFTPIIYSVDGMAHKHARAAEKRIAGMLASKWTRQYSQMASFLRTRMCLAIVRSNTLLLRGDRAMNWRRRAPDDGVATRVAMSIRVQ